jgi:energy-coupling factor transporter ATP-binding protein EcfA2
MADEYLVFTGRHKSGKSNLIRLLTGLNVARANLKFIIMVSGARLSFITNGSYNALGAILWRAIPEFL